jgi:hypothetical protein
MDRKCSSAEKCADLEYLTTNVSSNTISFSHTLARPPPPHTLSFSLSSSRSHLPCFSSRPPARSLSIVLIPRTHRWGVTLVAAGIGGATLYYILRNMSGPVIKNDFLEQALGQVCPCLFASPGESHDR